jgi:hypothetical protein
MFKRMKSLWKKKTNNKNLDKNKALLSNLIIFFVLSYFLMFEESEGLVCGFCCFHLLNTGEINQKKRYEISDIYIRSDILEIRSPKYDSICSKRN